MQLHAVRSKCKWEYQNTCSILVSPRFELPVSNQSAGGTNLTAHPSYQSGSLKSTQPRRPLDQVTCFKVVVRHGTSFLSNSEYLFQCGEKGHYANVVCYNYVKVIVLYVTPTWKFSMRSPNCKVYPIRSNL